MLTSDKKFAHLKPHTTFTAFSNKTEIKMRTRNENMNEQHNFTDRSILIML